MEFEISGINTIYDGWGRYLVADIRLPDGTTLRREIEDHGRATCVLAFDPEHRTALLVRQFRAPVFFAAQEAETLEAIAGIVEGSDPAACARREAMEEAGVALTALDHVVTGWSMPGISTERMDLYLAEYGAASRVAAGGGVSAEHENITVAEMPLAELAAMADAGALTDVKTLLLVQTLRLRRPELFAK
jgi:nudix-type nucleoside diphosphatase (YffH/AdpP family)